MKGLSGGALQVDEARDKSMPSAGAWAGAASVRQLGRWAVVVVVWVGFATMLAGFCTAVFVMLQFLLNVLLFGAIAGQP